MHTRSTTTSGDCIASCSKYCSDEESEGEHGDLGSGLEDSYEMFCKLQTS